MTILIKARFFVYTVAGHVEDSSCSSDILGDMVIYDQPLNWGTKQPIVGFYGQFGFFISKWNLKIGRYSFSGQAKPFPNGAYLYIEMVEHEGAFQLRDTQWNFGTQDGTNTQGDWNIWSGDRVSFYQWDGTSISAENYFELAPIIKLSHADMRENKIFSNVNLFMEMWL